MYFRKLLNSEIPPQVNQSKAAICMEKFHFYLRKL
jgi:hypothetical protein